jgi:hypothetical protein
MGKTTLVLASMTLAVLLAYTAAVLAAVPGIAQSAKVTLVGAGISPAATHATMSTRPS